VTGHGAITVNGRLVKAVVFDVFGTLAHLNPQTVPSPAHALYALAPGRQDLDFGHLAGLAEGRDGEAPFAAPPSLHGFLAWQEKAWFAAADYAGVPVTDRLLNLLRQVLKSRVICLYPEVLEVLADLGRAGVPWLACSNASLDVGPKLTALLPPELRPQHTVLSWQVGSRKPHRRMYDTVRKLLPAAPAETLFVGDRLDCDVRAPLRHGFQAVLVTRDKTPGAGPGAGWPDLRPLTAQAGQEVLTAQAGPEVVMAGGQVRHAAA
jgi:FMN phosphatase YigB (HAD superfamily)